MLHRILGQALDIGLADAHVAQTGWQVQLTGQASQMIGQGACSLVFASRHIRQHDLGQLRVERRCRLQVEAHHRTQHQRVGHPVRHMETRANRVGQCVHRSHR
ncbi:hypothetical protein D3C76_1415100 [compost metagenome]